MTEYRINYNGHPTVYWTEANNEEEALKKAESSQKFFGASLTVTRTNRVGLMYVFADDLIC